MITAQVIRELNSDYVLYVSGSLGAVVTRVLPPEEAGAEALIFVSKAPQLEAALKARAAVIIAHKNLTLPVDASCTFFSTDSIQLAMASLLPLFDGKMIRFNQEIKIHPTAVIHPSAHLGQNTSVGPFAVIGEHVRIGDGCTIGAHTVIECNADVGRLTILHPQVFIGSHCVLGAQCEVHPHTTIGADGFSFAPNKAGEYQKIPQIGRVVIGDRVEIGANCAIDRAALTETRIGSGTKFDNLCHIGHNCTIGENNVFAAGFKMAGSSHIGGNCMTGGEVSVADHVTITSGVILAGRTGVTNDLTEPGVYGGFPIEPLKDSLKTLTNLKYLTRIRKDLARVKKHLGLNED